MADLCPSVPYRIPGGKPGRRTWCSVCGAHVLILRAGRLRAHRAAPEGHHAELSTGDCACGWKATPRHPHRTHLRDVRKGAVNACRWCAALLESWVDLFCPEGPCREADRRATARTEAIEAHREYDEEPLPDPDQASLW